MAPSRRRSVTGNRLLDALPAKVLSTLTLEECSGELKDLLFEQDAPIEHVVFPVDCVCSMVTVLDGGGAIELATIGHEGMVGVPVFLGASTTNSRAMIQVPGRYVRMTTRAFRRAVGDAAPLRAVVQRYTQALFVQISQTVACNRAHSVQQRCARWLLQTHDRVENDKFPLTQEFLAQMLGVRRGTANSAARALQEAGVISYSRGRITILDRKRLEDLSCECYAIVDAELEKLIP